MSDAKRSVTARSTFGKCVAVLGIALLAGCDPVSLTVFGVGTATGVQHALNGISYKTFTAPLPQVRTATINSLNRMGIKVASREKTKEGEVIKASGSARSSSTLLRLVRPVCAPRCVTVFSWTALPALKSFFRPKRRSTTEKE